MLVWDSHVPEVPSTGSPSRTRKRSSGGSTSSDGVTKLPTPDVLRTFSKAEPGSIPGNAEVAELFSSGEGDVSPRSSADSAAACRRQGCQRCGEPKPSGRGRLLCDVCRAGAKDRRRVRHREYYDNLRQTCEGCGGEKPKGRGRRLCGDCADLGQWKITAKERAANLKKRKPCERCRRAKGPGSGRRYCQQCRKELEVLRTPKCKRCLVRPVARDISPHAKLCVTCRPIMVVPTEEATVIPKRVPSWPLATLLLRWVAQYQQEHGDQVTLGTGGRRGTDPLESLGTQARRLYSWINGESTTAQVDTVREILDRSAWNWWDVYNEDTVVRPFFYVDRWVDKVHRQWVKKEGDKGGYTEWVTSYVRVGRVPHGNAGTDHEALEQCEVAFTGMQRKVAA